MTRLEQQKVTRAADGKEALAPVEGIRPGDVITEVAPMGGKTQQVKNAKEAREAISKADLDKGVRLYVTSKDPESGQVMSRFVFIQQDDAK